MESNLAGFRCDRLSDPTNCRDKIWRKGIEKKKKGINFRFALRPISNGMHFDPLKKSFQLHDSINDPPSCIEIKFPLIKVPPMLLMNLHNV